MKNRFTGRLDRLFLNAVTLECRSPGAVFHKIRNTTDAGLKPSSMTLFDNCFVVPSMPPLPRVVRLSVVK